jgi:hypothetical protein
MLTKLDEIIGKHVEYAAFALKDRGCRKIAGSGQFRRKDHIQCHSLIELLGKKIEIGEFLAFGAGQEIEVGIVFADQISAAKKSFGGDKISFG